MALCELCKTWFAESLQQIHLDQLGKHLVDVRQDDMDRWAASYGSEKEEGWVEVLYNGVSTREYASLCQAYPRCWLCYRLFAVLNKQRPAAESHTKIDFDLELLSPWRRGSMILKISASPSPNRWLQRPSMFRFRLVFPGAEISDAEISRSEYTDSDQEIGVDPETKMGPNRTRLTYTLSPHDSADDEPTRLELLSDGKGSMSTESNETQQQLYDLRSARLKRLLDECRLHHKSCSVGHGLQGEAFLPTRLVEVGEDGKSARVVETSSLFSKGPVAYATLSYCWGKQAFTTLRTNNLEHFKHAVPVEEFGLTIQHALRVVHLLAVRFIWIDCLCILQDSPEDWRRHAVEMHRIYKGSSVNIAAASSSQVSDGFLTPALGKEPNQKLCFRLPGGIEIQEPSISRYRVGEHSYSVAPLRYRGWVLQECFLSPRNLYWTHGQAIWQCNEMVEAEFNRSMRFDSTYDLPFMYQGSLAAVEHTEHLDDLWYENVAPKYSDTKVTLHKDRFFALAGLVAMFHQRYTQLGTKTRYIAGFWEHKLVPHIGWQFFGDGPPDTPGGDSPTPEFYAPSWSWLGVRNANVRFSMNKMFPSYIESFVDGHPLSPVLKGVSVECEDSRQPFGPITSAHIRLQARVFDMDIPRRKDYQVAMAIGYKACYDIFPRLKRRRSDPSDFDIWTGDDRNSRSDLAELTLDQNVTLPPQISTTCLLVKMKASPDSIALEALILMLSGERDGIACYQRIGRLELRVSRTGSERFEDVADFFSEEELQSREFYFV